MSTDDDLPANVHVSAAQGRAFRSNFLTAPKPLDPSLASHDPHIHLESIPYILTRPFVVYRFPTRRPGETIRALVYNHSCKAARLKAGTKRPLHLDIHGGAFIGGIPEYHAPFCEQVAETSGAVVVSITYRFAPRYAFPAAHDDVEDALQRLLEHAEEKFNADPELLTASGFSAGGNLALGATLGKRDSAGNSLVKGVVAFYTPVRLSILMTTSAY